MDEIYRCFIWNILFFGLRRNCRVVGIFFFFEGKIWVVRLGIIGRSYLV